MGEGISSVGPLLWGYDGFCFTGGDSRGILRGGNAGQLERRYYETTVSLLECEDWFYSLQGLWALGSLPR